MDNTDVRATAEREGVQVHLWSPGQPYRSACCDRTLFEIPGQDFIVQDPSVATCQGQR